MFIYEVGCEVIFEFRLIDRKQKKVFVKLEIIGISLTFHCLGSNGSSN